MTSQMPGFLARLTRPFTSATKLGMTENGAGGAATTTTTIVPEGAQKATVAAGCFWGVEHLYRKHFLGKGLYDARVGYIGGHTKNPTYNNVCSGRTGHAEATQITFDPTKLTYAQIIEFFYRMHDPTTQNRQGNDVGTQYRSGIYFHDAEQEKIAREITKKVEEQWYKGKVSTEVVQAGEWWDAETYHQKYLHNNPGGYECEAHYVRDFPALT